VLGVVPQVVEVKGFLGSKTTFLTLVVTDRRLIFAEQSEEMWDLMDAEEKRMMVRFGHQSQDWRTFIASFDFGSPPWRVYQTKDPDRIVAESRENAVVPLPEIQSVQITLNADPDDEDGNSSSLLIRRLSGDLDFELPWGNGDEAQRLLSQVIAQVVTIGPDTARE